jgi:hypothetical protein
MSLVNHYFIGIKMYNKPLVTPVWPVEDSDGIAKAKQSANVFNEHLANILGIILPDQRN